MTSRRTLVGLVAGTALLVAACSDSQSTTPTTSTTAVTTTTATTVPPTTAAPATTTSTTTSTTTTSTTVPASTTTTIAAVKGLGLSATGLGDALFGADADGVVSYVESIVGSPSSDSGWVDPAATGSGCTGTEVRFVTWHDLALFFTDQSPAAKGFRHFASYTYGPAFGANVDPYGLATDAGISVGSTVKSLKTVYSKVKLFPGHGTTEASFFIEDGLVGKLTGTTHTDLVTQVVGGHGCGE